MISIIKIIKQLLEILFIKLDITKIYQEILQLNPKISQPMLFPIPKKINQLNLDIYYLNKEMINKLLKKLKCNIEKQQVIKQIINITQMNSVTQINPLLKITENLQLISQDTLQLLLKIEMPMKLGQIIWMNFMILNFIILKHTIWLLMMLYSDNQNVTQNGIQIYVLKKELIKDICPNLKVTHNIGMFQIIVSVPKILNQLKVILVIQLNLIILNYKQNIILANIKDKLELISLLNLKQLDQNTFHQIKSYLTQTKQINNKIKIIKFINEIKILKNSIVIYKQLLTFTQKKIQFRKQIKLKNNSQIFYNNYIQQVNKILNNQNLNIIFNKSFQLLF